MIQCRRCSGLALKSFQRLRIRWSVFRKKLQGYATVEPGILGAINHAHATTTELFMNTIVRDCLSAERSSLGHGAVILGVLPIEVNLCRTLSIGSILGGNGKRRRL